MVTGVSAGEADISATYQNMIGKVHITITASSATPTLSAVSLGGAAPGVGATNQFTAVATFSDASSKEVTNVAIWRSSNTAVATVNSGQVKGVAIGETDITATYQNVTGTLHITIGSSSGSPSGSPSSTPAPSTLSVMSLLGSAPAVGSSAQFSAIATYPDRSTTDVTLVASWRSSNTAVATVVRGFVTAVAAGEADIIATYQNVTGTLHVVLGAAPCVFSLFPQTVQMGSGGGTQTLTVLTGNGCSWTAKSSDPFMTITSAASGTGSGLVTISVAPDSGPARSATLTVGGFQVPVTQAGGQAAPNCGVSLLPASADYSAEMKESFVTVTVAPGCQWTASTTSTFIILNNTGPASGTGNGGFVYRLFGNITGAPRSTSIKVGQQTFTITQRAALGGNSLSFVSEPGDYVGQGWTVLHEAPTSTFTPTVDPSRNHVAVRIVGSDGLDTLDWSLNFAAPQGQQLAVGTYLNATRYPFQAPAVPGIDFSGDGRGCNQESGQFTIADVAYGVDGSLQRLSATFEQHCEGGAAALRGKIVYAR